MNARIAHRKHAFSTRLVHAGLALAVIVQLLTSLPMEPPAADSVGNGFFQIHQYSGLAAFAFVFAFWAVVCVRSPGTAPGTLFPWFSGSRLSALRTDARTHLAALLRRRLPPHDSQAALPSAIHGLGLLLISAMAVSGTVYYFINTGDPDAGGAVGAVMLVHRTLANVVWVYLFGHAGLGVIHHYAHDVSLGEMWSLERDAARPGSDSPVAEKESAPSPAARSR
ncbi:MAG: cytochrome b/b6 domain-containing protein [Rhodobacteraceae bacterium]|nr:cytochrome b/b6 domain-containing protein [Paracoccaceae bacterium]